jgi:hypothetical protein
VLTPLPELHLLGWSGPFEAIETACLAIARRHATEIADRHTRTIEHHQLEAGQQLYGLQSTTRLRARKSRAAKTA